MDGDHHRHRGDEADRREILGGISGIGIEARIDGDRAGAAQEQRVAVGCGFGDRARPDIAATAATIVDDHLLPERNAQL
jgi:hypothetical protein